MTQRHATNSNLKMLFELKLELIELAVVFVAYVLENLHLALPRL